MIDTAGMRKSGKVYENTEKYSVMRAMRAIDRSDVVLMVINAEEGINLAGIRRILELERRVEALEEERDALRDAVTAAEAKRNRVFAASADGQVMPIRRGERPWDRTSRRANGSGGSLTVWSPVRALAALAAAQTSARSALPAPPPSKAHDVIEGTVISQR